MGLIQRPFLACARRGARGFTLIEVMVVLIIISVMATVTAISIEGMQKREAQHEVDRLRRVLEIAAETATVRGSPLAVDFLPNGYRFSALDTSGEWHLLFNPQTLRQRPWPNGVSVESLEIDGVPVKPPFRLQFGSESPEFRLRLRTEDGTRTLVGLMSGAVEFEIPRPANG
ncbi:prepilin-type N-terminal cleavage/methylation domain-containing protein [Uliginosibacterium sp. sgz301328]|uniref:prepilin-type N-terminal cleavage/methylation domain-containing protein n=1 Tax=Uliginosibacterium sp. sgz301328 TaxID=3243764 RepID=UPI00359E5E02